MITTLIAAIVASVSPAPNNPSIDLATVCNTYGITTELILQEGTYWMYETPGNRRKVRCNQDWVCFGNVTIYVSENIDLELWQDTWTGTEPTFITMPSSENSGLFVNIRTNRPGNFRNSCIAKLETTNSSAWGTNSFVDCSISFQTGRKDGLILNFVTMNGEYYAGGYDLNSNGVVDFEDVLVLLTAPSNQGTFQVLTQILSNWGDTPGCNY